MPRSSNIFFFGMCPVRIRSSFGQLAQEIVGSCPNAGLIRTARSRNRWCLSEYLAHSDSSLKKSMVLVRILGSFGQLAQEIDGSCPNAGHFRTACSRNRRFLSECWSHSDSSLKKSSVLVRMLVSFGQFAQEIDGSCPNTRHFRTARLRNGWIRPNAGHFRTACSRNRRFLSECWSHSDSSLKKSMVLVRILGSFGQLAQEIDGSCPNAGLIRTARSRNRWCLSEYLAHSDSSLKKSMVLVRILGSFGQLAQEIDGSCPNAGHFRTACSRNRRFLSECWSHSDSSLKKSMDPVRKLGTFGQLAQEIVGSCPNAGLIRTARSRNRWILSEYGAAFGQNSRVMLFIPNVYHLK